MTERFDDAFDGVDAPRPLPETLRARMEDALIRGIQGEGSESIRQASEVSLLVPALEASTFFEGLDSPRPLPHEVRERVERQLTRKPRRQRGIAVVTAAASIVVVMLASAVLAARWRTDIEVPLPAAIPVPISPSPSPTAVPPPAPSPSPSPAPSHRSSLQGFRSPAQFLGYVRTEALRLVGPYGLPHQGDRRSVVVGMAARPAPSSEGGSEPSPQFAPDDSAASRDFSGTNVQEEGVDEPDLVKTDGHRLVALTQGKLQIVDVSGRTPTLVGSIAVPGADRYGSGTLLLSRDRVIHLVDSYEADGSWTRATIINIAKPSRPEVVATLKFEGSYVNSRLVGGVVRVVIRSRLGPDMVTPTEESPEAVAVAEAANRQAIARSTVGKWLPHYVIELPKKKPVTGHIHESGEFYRPKGFSGLSTITVLTIDPQDPRPSNGVSIIGAGEIVYASTGNLYVTSTRWTDILAAQEGRQTASVITQIHKFDISDPTTARYVASGEVKGHLLNQFSMSEHESYLRVASTTVPVWGTPTEVSESFVTVLSARDGLLVKVGSVGGLGRGERIYSVRFIGPMGYVVTFRQVDPLYVIDIHRPDRPKVLGELKIPGFSSYLHPISETLILGVGREADEETGLFGPLQVSLFDVSDPANPRRLHQRSFGNRGSSSEVETDHHAFLYWSQTGLLVLPAQLTEQNGDSPTSFVGALAMKVSATNGFGEPVRLNHGGRPGSNNDQIAIRRSLVVGTGLMTLSEMGLLTSELVTLVDRAWLPFQP